MKFDAASDAENDAADDATSEGALVARASALPASAVSGIMLACGGRA